MKRRKRCPVCNSLFSAAEMKTHRCTQPNLPLEKDGSTPHLEAGKVVEFTDLSVFAAEQGEPSATGEAKEAAGVEDQPQPQATDTSATCVALVGTVALIAETSTRLAAASRRLEWDDDLKKIAELSGLERGTLDAFAPGAAPYFETRLASTPEVGAVLFGLVTGWVLLGRFSGVSTQAKKEPAKRAAEDPPQQGTVHRPEFKKPKPAIVPDEAQAKAKMEHDRLWGSAAHAVDVGAVPEDTGTFADPNTNRA